MRLKELVEGFTVEGKDVNSYEAKERTLSGFSHRRSSSPGYDMMVNQQANSKLDLCKHMLDARVKAAELISKDIKEKSNFYGICKNYTAPLLSKHSTQ